MDGHEGWKYWIGKTVYLQLKKGRVYAGEVVEIDDKNPNIVFITILDKFMKRITFITSEINYIQEERGQE